ncbi:hypothetical protein SS05631_b55480 (plasmid) [Sinorhizobium sp. CCBAU 05631]|nr:hypothetical protein SS05631_b55480 [Sinorhizobium sp. CCBAU 05631]
MQRENMAVQQKIERGYAAAHPSGEVFASGSTSAQEGHPG